MATGPLRFRTPHIDELPTTQSRQAPGFAWVSVSGPQDDPAKNWGTTNRKRQRQSAVGPTDQQRETLNARQQRDIERKIRDLNSDGPTARDAQSEISLNKKGGGGAVRVGKTTNTKKILSSGKTFAHYLDDEEAEIARTGRRDGDVEMTAPPTQRASKTPLARRKVREESTTSNSPAPTPAPTAPPPLSRISHSPLPEASSKTGEDDHDDDDDVDPILPFPSQAELDALLNAPPLTYNQARSAPPPSTAPPPRRFCETCGYWGRVRCMKCGVMTCSVLCKDTHDQVQCLKMYA